MPPLSHIRLLTADTVICKLTTLRKARRDHTASERELTPARPAKNTRRHETDETEGEAEVITVAAHDVLNEFDDIFRNLKITSTAGDSQVQSPIDSSVAGPSTGWILSQVLFIMTLMILYLVTSNPTNNVAAT